MSGRGARTRPLPRRLLLQAGGAWGTLAALGATGCGKQARSLSCTDTSTLSSTDAAVRATLAYVDLSTEPGKTCALCQQFLPAPAANTCGACKVVKGPINPKGNCKSFVAKS